LFLISRRTCVLVLSLSLLVHPDRLQAQAAKSATDLSQRFITEAPSSWAKYLEFCGKLQGTVRTDWQNLKRKERNFRATRKISQNARCAIQSVEVLSSRGTEEVVAVANARYGFRLKKLNGNWLLDRLNPQPDVDIDGLSVRRVVSNWTAMPVYCYDFFLVDMVKDSRFSIASCQEVNKDHESLIQVVFNFPNPINPKKFVTPIQSGSLLLDPRRYWSVREYVANCKWLGNRVGRYNAVYSYDEGPQGFPIVRTMSSTLKMVPDDGSGIIDKHEFVLEVPNKLPDDAEFTLSAFGLPEPAGFQTRTPWYIWAFSLGLLSIAAGVGLAWYRRRALQ
jgi:hypothetical protein